MCCRAGPTGQWWPSTAFGLFMWLCALVAAEGSCLRTVCLPNRARQCPAPKARCHISEGQRTSERGLGREFESRLWRSRFDWVPLPRAVGPRWYEVGPLALLTRWKRIPRMDAATVHSRPTSSSSAAPGTRPRKAWARRGAFASVIGLLSSLLLLKKCQPVSN